jgi:hypothetical protein
LLLLGDFDSFHFERANPKSLREGHMRFMLTPTLIFGAALLAADVALVSGEDAPEDGRYARNYLSSAPSAYAESPPSNEAQDRQPQELRTGKDGADIKSGSATTSGDTRIGDTTSGDTTPSARSGITSPN